MPYRDVESKREYNRKYYLSNRERLNRRRTETRNRGKSVSDPPKIVSVPVTDPFVDTFSVEYEDG